MKIFIDLGAYDGDSLEKGMKLYPDFDAYYAFSFQNSKADIPQADKFFFGGKFLSSFVGSF